MTRVELWGAWPARACWVVLALVAQAGVTDALDGHSEPVRVVVAVALWLGWAVTFVALLVPRDAALTVLRTLVPAGVAAMVAASAAGTTVDPSEVAAVVLAALTAVVVFTPWVGEAWIDGSSYGNEHRFALRPPAVLTYALAPLTWLVVMTGAAVGPLLLATGRLAAGIAASAVGAAAIWAGGRSLHQLARRWVVLVPSGLVIHDPLTMPEAQLVPRRMISRLGAAPADTTAHDLTAGAPGLALQLDVDEPLELLVRDRGRTTATTTAASLIFTPTRPRRLLAAAQERRIPIG